MSRCPDSRSGPRRWRARFRSGAHPGCATRPFRCGVGIDGVAGNKCCPRSWIWTRKFVRGARQSTPMNRKPSFRRQIARSFHQVAGDSALVADCPQFRNLLAAARLRVGTTGVETAAGRRVGRTRRLPTEYDAATPSDIRSPGRHPPVATIRPPRHAVSAFCARVRGHLPSTSFIAARASSAPRRRAPAYTDVSDRGRAPRPAPSPRSSPDTSPRPGHTGARPFSGRAR